ncbi:Serpin domain-containing protein [Strongyloides ratti]|uniref:Serpin domain-containing protein n=1 Tax=Strongyloides ratti TaxID=34506 RepID=A0A090KTZ6_STRRB|nr:Serpin domain-containing protein [Strongyloides ratti]CEF60995.1 Serpin domain-containing protein [Strongyloides ratti]
MMELVRSKKIIIYLPKFKIESTYKLYEIIKEIGLILPFSNNADFSLITNDAILKIDTIIQKSFIDKEGTEATESNCCKYEISLYNAI